MTPETRRFCALGVLFITLVACSAAPGRPTVGARDQGRSAGEAKPKAVTMALIGDIRTLGGPPQTTFVSIPTRMIHPFMNDYISGRDQDDVNSARLATELPSVDRGTWKVLDDGRMEVTWKLRPGVKWHDGEEVTADDIAFSLKVALDPVALEGRLGRDIRPVERVEVMDRYTFVLFWKDTSRSGNDLSFQQVSVLPKHVLEAAYTADSAALLGHPWFTEPEAFVGAGPYRPGEWVRGSHLSVTAYDQYFQGRAKIDRVTFRFIPDSATAMSNILAGAVDISYATPGIDEALIIQREWARTGAGFVNLGPNNFRYYVPQMRPETVDPRDQLRLPVRKAYMYAVDRDEIVEGLFPGLKYVADSSNVPGTQYYDAVKDKLVRYAYEPNRAAQLLADQGWTKGTDGILEKDGRPFRLELRSAGIPEAGKAFSIMQPQFRRAGIDMTFTDLVTSNPNEDLALAPGWYFTSLGVNIFSFGAAVRSNSLATPANRYSGSNRSAYINPMLEAAFESMDRSTRLEEQLRYWGDVWHIVTDDLAILPMWYVPLAYIVRSGVTGPIPEGASPTKIMVTGSWNVHLWDVRG